MPVFPHQPTASAAPMVSATGPPETGNPDPKNSRLGNRELDNLDLHNSSLPAILMSLVFHLLLLTLLGVFWSQSSAGTLSEVDRPVGIAMVHRLPDRDRYVDSLLLPESVDVVEESAAASSAAAAANSVADSSAAQNLIPLDLAPLDLDGVLSEMQATPSPVSGSGLAGETELDGDAFAAKPSPGGEGEPNRTTTTVFGVSGSGSRFVYVFDRSDSMNANGARPLRAAKRELSNSLKTLSERQQFQLIFYNQQPKLFQAPDLPPGLMFGEAATLDRAARYVESITAYGATEHFSAISMALQLGPDVIFFLTDARIPRLSTSQLAEIRRRAQRSGTTIYTIEFGSQPAAPNDSFLIDLASQNGGQYQYVDIRSLEVSP